MFRFTEPQDSPKALDEMVADAEELCSRLGLHHRVLLQCTGDLGFASIKTYDVELWAPGSGDWLEVSSVSNCTDFQGPTRQDTVPRGGRRSSRNSRTPSTAPASAFLAPSSPSWKTTNSRTAPSPSPKSSDHTPVLT